MKQLVVVAGITLMAAMPLPADVTITANASGKGMGQMVSGESVTYVKGSRLRMDRKGPNGGGTSTIMDVSAMKQIVINHQKKEAEVYDISKMAAQMQQVVKPEEIQVKVTPSGETKQILGKTCEGYDISVRVPMSFGQPNASQAGLSAMVVLEGRSWIAKGVPGTADYTGFWKSAAANGMFFGNPQQLKAAPGQAKGMTAMYEAMSKLDGLAYGYDMALRFEGNDMMAGMMNKMGGFSMSQTATAVSADPIPEEVFGIPAGYKVSNK